MDEYNEDEIDIRGLFKVLNKYKWFILIFTIFFLIIGYTLLSFKKPLYSSYAIIKIKDSSKSLIPNSDFPIERINVKEHIAILNTFYINNQALNLNRVNFKIQYYKNDYKGSEIYKLQPIKVVDIKILDKDVLGRRITLTPQMDGFTLEFKLSFSKKIKSYIFGSPFMSMESHIFKYNKNISTKYFNIRVNKLSNFDEPIDIVINGDHRFIYENIIKKNLEVSQLEMDIPFIKIEYKDNIQERATKYIESLTTTLIRESIKNKSEQNNKILSFINQELDKMKKRLKMSEKELERYRVSNKAVRPTEQARVFISELSNIDISISENQLRESLVGSLMKFIKGNYNLDSIAPSLMELNDNPTLELIGVLQKSELKRDELLEEFTIKHPLVKAEESKINIVRGKIISNIKNLKKHLTAKKRNLRRLKNSYENRLKRLPTKERKLVNIKRDYEVSSKMYNFLLEKQAENEIARVATLSNYKIIDKAFCSSKSIGASSNLFLSISVIIGLIISIFITFVHNAFNDNLRDVEDIESLTNTPIFGVIPFVESIGSKVGVYSNPNNSYTESFRDLRINLQLEDNTPKVILVTSMLNEDTRCEISMNLSAIFEMAKYRTIIIDLDMRGAKLDRLFNIQIDKGISSYLVKECSLSDIIYPTKYPNLKVIPVGISYPNPSELILSEYLPKLINELRLKYDYIIINSPSLKSVTDTKHIMKFSDINLFVFKETFSKKSSLSGLNLIANQKKFKKIGIVFMKSTIS
jgi:capsular exopolysaccharide synthesis family protein